LGRTITATVAPVANATAYIWTLPEGLSAPSLTTSLPSLTITGDIEGNYNAANIKVVAKTCENAGTALSGSGAQLVVANNPKWGTVEGASGTIYTTYDFGDLGKLMVDNSKEDGYTTTTFPGHTPGERGYYYTMEQARATPPPCPVGWVLPTHDEMLEFFNALTPVPRHDILNPTAVQGGWMDLGEIWEGWSGSYSVLWLSEDYVVDDVAYVTTAWYNTVAGSVITGKLNTYINSGLGRLGTVRCILK
jgi:hypothetical protein